MKIVSFSRYYKLTIFICVGLLAGAVLPAFAQKLTSIPNQIGKSPMELHFTALDGRYVDLRKLKGKVVLIDFWAATWCGNCRKETPILKALYDKYHTRGLEMIGITMELKQSDRLFLSTYIQKNAIPWPQYFDGKGVKGNPFAMRFGVKDAPHLILIDRKGEVRDWDVKEGDLEAAVLGCLETVRDIEK